MPWPLGCARPCPRLASPARPLSCGVTGGLLFGSGVAPHRVTGAMATPAPSPALAKGTSLSLFAAQSDNNVPFGDPRDAPAAAPSVSSRGAPLRSFPEGHVVVPLGRRRGQLRALGLAAVVCVCWARPAAEVRVAGSRVEGHVVVPLGRRRGQLRALGLAVVVCGSWARPAPEVRVAGARPSRGTLLSPSGAEGDNYVPLGWPWSCAGFGLGLLQKCALLGAPRSPGGGAPQASARS